MGIQAVTGDGGDIGDSCNLKIESALIQTKEFNGSEVFLSEEVHEECIVLSICRWSSASDDLNFAVDSGEASTAGCP